LSDVFGVIAAISSLAFNVIGAGSQVLFHFKTKQVKITALFLFLGLITSLAWMAYGISTGSPYLIITQAIGGILTVAILVQKFFIYRNPKSPN
jgi:membrane associated rhomboid family serine protease